MPINVSDSRYSVSYLFLDTPTNDQIRQIIELYQYEGWWTSDDDPELIKQIIKGSHCFVIATIDTEIVGMGRCISDKCCDAYIQDVAVKAAYRGKGIGKGIIQKLTQRLIADGIDWIGLIAEKNSNGFYERFGFQRMGSSIPMLKRIHNIK